MIGLKSNMAATIVDIRYLSHPPLPITIVVLLGLRKTMVRVSSKEKLKTIPSASALLL